MASQPANRGIFGIMSRSRGYLGQCQEFNAGQEMHLNEIHTIFPADFVWPRISNLSPLTVL